MSVDVDLGRLGDHLIGCASDRRLIVAVAGAPGSGKSTLAEALATDLDRRETGVAAVLAMDGFHFDDLLLVPMGLRARKGGPETFDVAGLRHMLARLRAGDESAVAVPVFDRSIEIARAGARLIPRTARIIIVEGNYLLLRRPPWDTLRPMFDVTAIIDVPEPVLRQRLTERWLGYALTPEEIAWKLDGNDLPNGRVVATESIEPDFRLRS